MNYYSQAQQFRQDCPEEVFVEEDEPEKKGFMQIEDLKKQALEVCILNTQGHFEEGRE